MGKTKKKTKSSANIITMNRRALHDYFVVERLEVGIVLAGSEVKSLRDGNAHLSEAYVRIEKGQMSLVNAHIGQYRPANRYNHEPERRRRLLAHGREIERLAAKVQAKGVTLIPLSLYWNEQGRAKLELGLCRGKRQYDQRHVIRERDELRDMDREQRDKDRQ